MTNRPEPEKPPPKKRKNSSPGSQSMHDGGDRNLDSESQDEDAICDQCYCGSEDHSAMIKCTHCEKWIHYECTGLSVSDISACINELPGCYACKICYPSLTVQQVADYRTKSKSGRLFAFGSGQGGNPASQVQHFLNDDQFKAMLAQISKDTIEIATKTAMEVVQEFWEKKEKKNNLVVVGFPDKKDSEKEQNAHDRKVVSDICENLGVDPKSVVSTFREGRVPGKRIMKVCFGDRQVSERRTFLAKASDLIRALPECKSQHFRAFVRPDLTAKQREADYQLRGELKRRRDSGEQNLVIRNGRIIVKPGTGGGFLNPGNL